MKNVALALALAVLSSTVSGCGAIRSGLASASARHIRGCTPEELQVSNTYGTNPFSGPSWKATCHSDVYECTGYMQVASTVTCKRLPN